MREIASTKLHLFSRLPSRLQDLISDLRCSAKLVTFPQTAFHPQNSCPFSKTEWDYSMCSTMRETVAKCASSLGT
jgi:hypothetical protein